jgi:hypothetical protein
VVAVVHKQQTRLQVGLAGVVAIKVMEHLVLPVKETLVVMVLAQTPQLQLEAVVDLEQLVAMVLDLMVARVVMALRHLSLDHR